MEFKHSIVRVALRRDSIIQVKTVILIALLAQLGLSRVREFDADRLAAELTGDPQGLALALAKIERESRAWLLPGWGKPEPS